MLATQWLDKDWKGFDSNFLHLYVEIWLQLQIYIFVYTWLWFHQITIFIDNMLYIYPS